MLCEVYNTSFACCYQHCCIHVALQLFSNLSHVMSKCGKREKKIKVVAGYVTDVLKVPHLASSAIYYPTDAWQCAIYLFYITRNKKCVNNVIILCTCICPPIADKKKQSKCVNNLTYYIRK